MQFAGRNCAETIPAADAQRAYQRARKRNTGPELSLIHILYPDYTDRDLSQKGTGGNYMEGLASISAVLKQAGHSVQLLHLHNLHTEENYKKRLREAGEFDIIGFSVRTTAFPDVQEMCIRDRL